MPHKFSIITPSYNQGMFIRQTVDSVLSQSYPHLEYLVFDGGSTDETVEILRSYDDPRMMWVSEPDKGQSDAINKGLVRATGDIFAYLNSDDILLPDTLKIVDDYFTAHPEADLVHGDCVKIDADDNVFGEDIGQEFSYRLLFTKRWHIPQPSTFWRRRVTDTIGFFDPSLHYVMDHEYWIRVVIAGFSPHYIHQSLSGYRYHDQSKTVSLYANTITEWKIILPKIFALQNLPPEVKALETLSYAYFTFFYGDLFWTNGQRPLSRPYLRRVLTMSSPLRLKVISLAMLIDGYLGRTFFSSLLKTLYTAAR